MSLPPPLANQAFCDVSALESGILDVPEDMFITNAVPGKVLIAPSLSFLLQHSGTKKKFLFDLGIRKDYHNLPTVVADLLKSRNFIKVEQDVLESLEKGGLQPADIDYVCLSHCHWDHTGDTHVFKQSQFIVGAGCRSLFEDSWPSNPQSSFAADLLPEGRTEYLDPSDWKPIGPFPRAFDFFGDGSLYIIDAPGHLPGHANVLARTSSDGGWIYLAGDSAHHRKLITLEADIAVGHPAWNCAHVDKEAAHDHIVRINKLLGLPRVQVLLAHDEPWYSTHKGGSSFWPGKIESL
ncbi:hypothetical protein D9613_005917 [Agrocybe pediades]|uniref:Metallo-beta-lactamase domain-containing protein n=1 Tax=Agrocybe pediades TaxID=84607 RepID=A0A8H4VRD5_9AGAR|nr:hypothetical protein D9613_005917 [Agrocybe pediades]